MKIKKISIAGFKSFTDRIEVPFSEGLSAIVGPNGCGKSNLVDAIRWAMGEQSAKILRGRQMEDVIFSGSEQTKPMGMAEVSLVFENGDGSFPAQFADQEQISVTRRLYRSGESEYLLNNVSCRLKDIQEIFMDTGLGNRAYSIIGQGKIGSIIEQKPEETRAMLEEAAGITKYKKKVEESQRKIELAKGNLQRVEDVLGEVLRQMGSLKRQAAKARRYKAIGEEIQRLEITLAANSFAQWRQESENRSKNLEDLAREEIGRSAGFTGLLARIETMNLELDEKEKEISALRGKHLHAKEKVGRKESVLESLSGEKRMQLELAARLEKEKQEVFRRQEELRGERQELLRKIEEVKERARGLEDERALLDRRMRGRQDFLKEVREVYEEARTRVNSGISKEMGLTQESGYVHKRLGEITDGRARLQKEKEDLALRMEGLMKASEKKSQVREALASKLKDIEEDLTREQGLERELGENRRSVEAELRSREGEFQAVQSKLASLRALTENFEGYKAGVRSIMKAEDLNAKKEGRIMGLVADVIHVDSGLEQAVEAVLSDRLQSIIVARQEDGKEAVDYLKLKSRGKSSFVPLNDLNGHRNGTGANGFPLLKDLVRVPEEYKSLMDLLMGDAALVPDLDQAISAWKEHGKNLCLVTPEGDMVDPSGIISGGRLAHTSHGILARKREIRELEEAVDASRRKVEALQQELEVMTARIEEKKRTLETLTDEKWACQEQLNELDKVIFQLSHELDQTERLSGRIGAELEQKDQEQERQKEALSRIQAELEHCRERRKQEDEYLIEKERELRESEEEYERFRDELARVKMNLGLATEEEKGLLREVERLDQFARESEGAVRRIEEDILNGRTRHADCERQEETLREELSLLYQDLEEAQSVVAQAEREREEFRNGIREQDSRAEALRAELEQLKEKIHAAKMEQSEVGFKMNGLVETIRDKYNLNLQEIYTPYLVEGFSPAETREALEHQKVLRERLGEVNLTAIQEHEALKERHAFMSGQREDLIKSIDSLQEAIRRINRTSLERFMETFEEVDKKLKTVFPILFNGGSAGLRLTDPEKPLESGILVEVRPPGKKLSHMGLLSGGEKALVAMALLFAIYLIKPSPFCLLDEVDAPLDEANIDRFNNLLMEIRKYSQIILVTHNRRSMEIVDRLYGVTMERQGVSKIVTVNLEGAERN
ncbi:MAG: chromosome segregation protein SMC [Thermodesulfobacteriota bacterium]